MKVKKNRKKQRSTTNKPPLFPLPKTISDREILDDSCREMAGDYTFAQLHEMMHVLADELAQTQNPQEKTRIAANLAVWEFAYKAKLETVQKHPALKDEGERVALNLYWQAIDGATSDGKEGRSDGYPLSREVNEWPQALKDAVFAFANLILRRGQEAYATANEKRDRLNIVN